MFPVLDAADAKRAHRFGVMKHYPYCTRLPRAGAPGAGLYLMLAGTVAVTQRDGLGRVTPVAVQGAGQFPAEVGTLSGRPALMDRHANEDVDALLVPLTVAKADLG